MRKHTIRERLGGKPLIGFTRSAPAAMVGGKPIEAPAAMVGLRPIEARMPRAMVGTNPTEVRAPRAMVGRISVETA